MKGLNKVYLLMFLAIFVTFATAASIDIRADDAPFEKSETITFYGDLLDSSGSALTSKTINYSVVDQNSSPVTSSTATTNASGRYSYAFSTATAGSYTVTSAYADDTGVSASMPFKVVNASVFEIAFTAPSSSPPFQTTSNVSFTITAKTSAGVGVASESITAKLKDSTGTVYSTQTATTNGSGVTSAMTFPVSTLSLSPGMYYIDINNGLTSFGLPLYSYKIFVDTLDSDSNPKKAFGTSETITLRAVVKTFAETEFVTGATVSFTVLKPDGTTSIVSGTGTTGRYTGAISGLSTIGKYGVETSITKSGITQKAFGSFNIQAHDFQVEMPSSVGGGGPGEKEQMPAVYGPGKSISLNLFVANVGGERLTDVTTYCDSNALSLYYTTDDDPLTKVTMSGTYTNQTTYCQIDVTTPATENVYFVTVEGDFAVGASTETLSATQLLLVQNYLIFMQPVDATTGTFKFDYYKGATVAQQLGFGKNLSTGATLSNSDITGITAARMFEAGTDIDLTSLASWGSNLVQFVPPASTAGGFHPLGMTLTINDTGTPASAVAFGMFNYKVLNVTVKPTNSGGTVRTENFGPPSFKPTETIKLKVTAKTAGNVAIPYATVSVSGLFNFQTFESVSTSGISSATTDANGIAYLTLGQLGSGGYDVVVNVDDGTNSDEQRTWFEVRNYMLFAQPVDPTDSQCQYKQAFMPSADITLVLQAFDPTDFGTPISDITVTDVSAMYFGSMNKPQWPPAEDTGLSFTTSTISCSSMGPTPVDMPLLTISKTGDWAVGGHDLRISATSATKGDEIGMGFLNIQSFLFTATPAYGWQDPRGTVASPGGTYLAAMRSSDAVNINAQLMDPMAFQAGGIDLNISPTSLVANTDTNVTVDIPADTPLKERALMFTATNADSETATVDMFLMLRLYNTIVPTVYNLTAASGTPSTGGTDWNTVSLTYDKWNDGMSSWPEWGTLPNGQPVLWDTAGGNVYIDANRDLNFVDAVTYNKGNTVSEVTISSGSPIITTIAENGLNYINSNEVSSLLAGWNAGEYPVNSTFYYPVVVTDLNNNPVSGASVTFDSIRYNAPGSLMPTYLSSSDYNISPATTDATGLALVSASVGKTGTYFRPSIKITKASNTQTLDPWDATGFNIVSFAVSQKLVGELISVALDSSTFSALTLDNGTHGTNEQAANTASALSGKAGTATRTWVYGGSSFPAYFLPVKVSGAEKIMHDDDVFFGMGPSQDETGNPLSPVGTENGTIGDGQQSAQGSTICMTTDCSSTQGNFEIFHIDTSNGLLKLALATASDNYSFLQGGSQPAGMIFRFSDFDGSRITSGTSASVSILNSSTYTEISGSPFTTTVSNEDGELYVSFGTLNPASYIANATLTSGSDTQELNYFWFELRT